jgi:hypothetical protein
MYLSSRQNKNRTYKNYNSKSIKKGGRPTIKHGLHRLQASGSIPPPLGECHRHGNSREAAKWGRPVREFGRLAIHWAHTSVAFAHSLLVSGVFLE